MALLGDKSPASIALRAIETHKPPNPDKVAPPGEKLPSLACEYETHMRRRRELAVARAENKEAVVPVVDVDLMKEVHL